MKNATPANYIRQVEGGWMFYSPHGAIHITQKEADHYIANGIPLLTE